MRKALRNDLTCEEVRSLVKYDPETGIFTSRAVVDGMCSEGNRVDRITKSRRRYSRIRLKGKRYSAGRVAFLYMMGRWPTEYIDHINRDKNDNRWFNLREVSNKENMINVGNIKSNSSGIRGVAWHKQLDKWRAFIMIDGKQKHLGVAWDFDEAVCLRLAAEQCLGWTDWVCSSVSEDYVIKRMM